MNTARGQLHTFDTKFGLKLSHLVFSATEQLSCFLQTKDVSLQEALRQAAVAVRLFEQNRSDEATSCGGVKELY